MFFLDDLPFFGKYFPSTQQTGKNFQRLSSPAEDNLRLQKMGWVGGTAMMIRKEVIDEIGLLDEKIFMYAEDIEFCVRARDHHWDIAIHPQAYITHFGSASSSSENAILGEIRGYLYIWAKHKPFWQMNIVRSLLVIGVYLRIFLFGVLLRDSKRANIYKKAISSL